MASFRFRGRRQARNRTLLLVALGAIGGLALGVVLADRTAGLDGLTSRVRNAKRRRRADLDDAESVEPVSDPAGTFAADDIDDEAEDSVETFQSAQAEPDDMEIEARVLEVFRHDPTLRGRAIDIGAIGNGVVELTGWVYSAEELAYALTLARGVPEVVDVMDSLAVRDTGGTRAVSPRSER